MITMFSPLKHLKGRDLLLNGLFSTKGTVTRSHPYTAPHPAPKREIRHVIGILDGLVLSSMPFHPLRTLPPTFLNSTEVIHTV